MGNKREYPDDDGRVIADMSSTEQYRPRFSKPRRKHQNPVVPEPEARDTQPQTVSGSEPLTKEQARWAAFASLRAALLIALIFVGSFALFILFCIYIWFR